MSKSNYVEVRRKDGTVGITNIWYNPDNPDESIEDGLIKPYLELFKKNLALYGLTRE
jgi:hypothetical protein